MEPKIQLKHPTGKKAVKISISKYETLKDALIQYLSLHGQGTFSEIAMAIRQNIQSGKISFEGSLEWYLEWVKLDLEANDIIARISGTSPQQYKLIP